MSATSGVSVLRYSALVAGLAWGFYHQKSILAASRATAEKNQYEHKLKLIQKAKEEFAKTKSKTADSTTGGLNQDPMSPNFDMEAFFNALVNEKS